MLVCLLVRSTLCRLDRRLLFVVVTTAIAIGIMATPFALTKQGLETQFGTNHIGMCVVYFFISIGAIQDNMILTVATKL